MQNRKAALRLKPRAKAALNIKTATRTYAHTHMRTIVHAFGVTLGNGIAPHLRKFKIFDYDFTRIFFYDL